ncbi:hypothetical protein BpHYR1_043010 [Brachionus plicatilis]|uniref:Uncharacterized protein n=1 Tax=Brachionus plicatilis TaxID=10195 RepID=A0A3M7QLQ0_BRAPC|nr:hypothetical protein BpHYR1_043010 [Brachionus plicatilis]
MFLVNICALKASTPAPATPRIMFAPAPFIKAMKPSFLIIFKKQSNEPLYFSVCPEVIIMRLRTVSNGYETISEATVTA